MNWLPPILHRRKLYGDLAEEMREHLEEKTEQFIREGMDRKAAEQAARRAFGNSTVLEDAVEKFGQSPTLELSWADVRYALRQLSSPRRCDHSNRGTCAWHLQQRSDFYLCRCSTHQTIAI